MTDLERVARAIAEGFARYESGSYDPADGVISYIDDANIDLRAIARAAIEALREPSGEMVRAGQSVYEQDWEYGITDDDMAKALTAAIEAALTPPSSPDP